MKDGIREEEARTDSPGKWATFGVDLNKSSQTYFLFSFALHANIMQKGKEGGQNIKNLMARAGGMQRGRRRGCRARACTKWPVNVADAIASAISRCEVFA